MVRIRSRILNETVVAIEDAERLPPWSPKRGDVGYRRRELDRMAGLPAGDVVAIHHAKRNFGGEYIGPHVLTANRVALDPQTVERPKQEAFPL